MNRLNRLKAHYPYAAVAVCLATLGAGQPALFLMALVVAILLLPWAFGADVDDIARAARERDKR
jgi:hypothetical protein